MHITCRKFQLETRREIFADIVYEEALVFDDRGLLIRRAFTYKRATVAVKISALCASTLCELRFHYANALGERLLYDLKRNPMSRL